MKNPCRVLLPLLMLLMAQWVSAAELAITRVTQSVYSAIGETLPPSYENGGHNNNLSFVVTGDGVLVVNGGDSYLLAQALHRAIRARTDQPVRWVVNENGQGHAFLGNSYWAEQGVPIIAQRDAIEEIKLHGEAVLSNMRKRNKEKAAGTSVAVPGRAVDELLVLQIGTTRIEILQFGAAHSPGDISVWLPQSRVLIAGDIAFHQRLLGIFPDTDVASWIESLGKMAALDPQIVVPGHGAPTNMQAIEETTLGYLLFLTGEMERILEEDGDLSDAYAIDQSAYEHLNTFKELAGKNAGRLFQTMEMDSF